MQSLWNVVVYALKVMGPLVHVIRLVDKKKNVCNELHLSGNGLSQGGNSKSFQ
jgi:hypothetical protein